LKSLLFKLRGEYVPVKPKRLSQHFEFDENILVWFVD